MKKAGFYFLMFACVVFLCFAFLASFFSFKEFFTSIDFRINDFFLAIQNGFFFSLMNLVSFFGSFVFLALLSLVLFGFWLHYGFKKRIVFFNFTIISGMFLGLFIKYIVQRERPENLLEDSFAFPSGHTLAAILAYWALAYIYWDKKRKISYLLIALPFVIGFSRLYLNVHWLSDVLGSFAIGVLWLSLSIWLFYKDEKLNNIK